LNHEKKKIQKFIKSNDGAAKHFNVSKNVIFI